MISIILPAYNEEAMLEKTAITLKQLCENNGLEYQLVFVDDGSNDMTWRKIEMARAVDSHVTGVHFSRNFGKEAAMYAGLAHTDGDYVAIMDADLQDPPSLLPEMFKAVTEEGFDSAATRRVTRKGEPVIRSFFARMFYKLMARISKTEIVDGARDYRIMTRQMVNAILSMGEYNRFTKGIYGWVGFETKWFEYENVERVAGETKWSFWKLFMYSIEGVIGFSTAPLVISSFFGILCMLLAFVMIVFIIIRKLIYGDPTSGWPSLVCIIMLIGGMQLSCIGIVGEYLAKTYLETKHRPIYIAKEIR